MKTFLDALHTTGYVLIICGAVLLVINLTATPPAIISDAISDMASSPIRILLVGLGIVVVAVIASRFWRKP